MPKNGFQKGAIEISTFAGIAIVAAVIVVISTIAVIKYREMPSVVAPVAVISPKLKSVLDETVDWQTYRNEEYGFTLVLPLSWKGYRTVLGNTNNVISFELPTSDKKWNYGSGFSSVFGIIILSIEEYYKLYKTDNLYDFENDKYVFQFVFSSNGPDDLPPINEEEILSTFKFTK